MRNYNFVVKSHNSIKIETYSWIFFSFQSFTTTSHANPNSWRKLSDMAKIKYALSQIERIINKRLNVLLNKVFEYNIGIDIVLHPNPKIY